MDYTVATNTLFLVQGATAVAAAAAQRGVSSVKTYSANGATTAGAGTATIKIEGSMDGGVTWDSTAIGTISLTLGTTSSSDSFTSTDRYKHVRANVTALTGTGASVNALVGY